MQADCLELTVSAKDLEASGPNDPNIVEIIGQWRVSTEDRIQFRCHLKNDEFTTEYK